MSRDFKRLSRTLLLGTICLLIGNPLLSKEGRDFAGLYEVSDIKDLGLDVALTLSLRVFNHTEYSVNGATVTLNDSVLLGTSYATFAGTTIPENGSVNLTANVKLPHSEYDLWQAGGTPHLEIEFRNASGNLVHRLIELSPRPVGREE